ncbi:MAG: pantothenate kinase [Calothrix sp. C42_A2020_038]|nr:pantothenate kinase [Calothrix sp. C42_A2020_038]
MLESWLGLMIGNSRLHWGLFCRENFVYSWDSNYLSMPDLPCPVAPTLPLFLASVVPSQTVMWQNLPNVKIITLKDVPLQQIYPSLGIDRALAVLGAGVVLGFPVLVIDAGTALTFTGADNNRVLIGGGILPGLGMQMAMLETRTGQLPHVEIPQHLPSRWGLKTSEAIQSGVIYTLLAGIQDFVTAWLLDFPLSKVVITGGNSTLVYSYLKSLNPEIASRILVEGDLIFWGMAEVINCSPSLLTVKGFKTVN